MNQELRKITLLDGDGETGGQVNCQFSGRYCFAVAGTFGGGTVGLEMLGPDGITWIAIGDASGPLAFTAAGASIVELPEGTYRASVAGAADADLTANLKRIID